MRTAVAAELNGGIIPPPHEPDAVVDGDLLREQHQLERLCDHAIVMASAAQRGGIVYTSDLADLERLRAHFPSVRLLRA